MKGVFETKFFELINEIKELKNRLNESDEQNKKLNDKIRKYKYQKQMNFQKDADFDQPKRSDNNEATNETKNLLDLIEKLTLSNDNLSEQLSQAEINVEDWKTKTSNLNNLKAELAEVNEKATLKIAQLKSENHKLELELRHQTSLVKNLENMQKNNEKEISTKSDNQDYFENKFNDKVKQFKVIEEELNMKELTNKRLEKSKKVLQKEIEDLQGELQEVRQNCLENKTMKKMRKSMSVSKSNLDLKGEESENLSNQLKHHESTIITQKNNINLLETDIEELKKKNRKCKEELNEQLEINLQLEGEIFNLKKEMNRLTNSLKISEENFDDLQAEYDNLEAENLKLKNVNDVDLGKLKSTIEEKDEEIEALRKSLMKNEKLLKEDVQYYSSKVDKLTASLKIEQNKQMELEVQAGKIETLKNQIFSLEDENSSLKSNTTRITAEKTDLENNIKTLSTKLENLKEENDKLYHSNESLKKSTTFRIEELECEVNDMMNMRQILMEDKNSLRHQLKSYEEELSELTMANEECIRIREDDLKTIVSLESQLSSQKITSQNLQQEHFQLQNNYNICKNISKSSELSYEKLNEKYIADKRKLDDTIRILEQTVQDLEQEKKNSRMTIKKLTKEKKEIAHEVEMTRASEVFLRQSIEKNQNDNRNLKKLIRELEDEAYKSKSSSRTSVGSYF